MNYFLSQGIGVFFVENVHKKIIFFFTYFVAEVHEPTKTPCISK